MVTPIRTEYLEVDDVALDCPAWEVGNLEALWDLPEYRGGEAVIPYRRGVLPFRRSFGGKRVDLDMLIVGTHDPDGTPATDIRAQLWENRNELVRTVFRPIQVENGTGERVIRYYAPDGGTLSGPGKIIGGLRPVAAGPGALKASPTLLLTEGGLRSETEVDVTSAEVSDAGSLDVTVPNPGNDYQDELLITLTGTATAVALTNLSAEPGGDVFIEFGGDISDDVVIDTADFTAIRDSVSVIGLITFGGFERWLPLIPGENTIRIEPTGGTATVQFQHYPFYA